MTDFGDDATEAQERHLQRSLARAGVKSSQTIIPPPHYDPDPEPAFCRACGGKPEVGALCGPCGHQLDKGGR
ncbi:MAG: hypothetical protein Q7R40_06505 [Phaeospirillum sp.]|nr:hypothetical protein [Phaeospirillum sp.]